MAKTVHLSFLPAIVDGLRIYDMSLDGNLSQMLNIAQDQFQRNKAMGKLPALPRGFLRCLLSGVSVAEEEIPVAALMSVHGHVPRSSGTGMPGISPPGILVHRSSPYY